MVENGRQIGIDITAPRRILLVSIIPRRGPATVALQRSIDTAEGSVRKILNALTDPIVFKSGSALVCLVPRAEDARMMEYAGAVKTRIETDAELTVCAGIDDAVGSYIHIRAAYQHAQKALRTCMRSPSRDIRLYDSINMEIFSGEIPDLIKLEYIRRIFRNCPLEEIESWIALLDTYYGFEGSITQAAQALFIHKNTLQYRLRQLHEKTGYDPRSIRFSSLYYNAIHFYHDLGGKLEREPEAEESLAEEDHVIHANKNASDLYRIP